MAQADEGGTPTVWGADPTGRWQPLAPSPFPAERALHELVAEGPQMLPLSGSPRLTVLGVEVPLGAGRADVIAVESSGRLTIVEVKLAGNAEARRAVVAQVLSYAAYLQGLDIDFLEAAVLRTHLRLRGAERILDAVREQDQDGSVDEQAFTDGLTESLATGAFRLVLVLDSVPDDLVQLVGYLETVTDKVVVDLVTVTPYDVNGCRILVPQRIDPARRAATLSTAEAGARQAGVRYPGPERFRAALAEAPEEQRALLTRLADWADGVAAGGGLTLSTYCGLNGITTLLPRLRREDVGLVTIYQEPTAAYVQLWPSVFRRRAPGSIVAVEAALGHPIRYGQRLTAVSDELLAALTAAYAEATAVG